VSRAWTCLGVVPTSPVAGLRRPYSALSREHITGWVIRQLQDKVGAALDTLQGLSLFSYVWLTEGDATSTAWFALCKATAIDGRNVRMTVSMTCSGTALLHACSIASASSGASSVSRNRIAWVVD
jgi:hypothetical protein